MGSAVSHPSGQTWRAEAACRGMDGELFHPSRGDHHTITAAKAICAVCPVCAECLATALKNRESCGIWGGKTARERLRLGRLR